MGLIDFIEIASEAVEYFSDSSSKDKTKAGIKKLKTVLQEAENSTTHLEEENTNIDEKKQKITIKTINLNDDLYDNQIEQLISYALVDGELTEKEKQILFKKAQAQGIDLDEFEMVLDARLVQLKKEEKEKAEKSAPKSNKLGDVRKCPQCGAVIGTFRMACPECGFEFSGVGANKFVEKFASELQKQLENIDGGSGSWFEIFDTTEILKSKRRDEAIVKAETIFVRTYPLPMTKEDCVEMLNYMLPRTLLEGSNAATKAWRNKFYAILSKLEFENKNDIKIQELVVSYKKQTQMSILGHLVLWYKSLSRLVKVILWGVISYTIVWAILGLVVYYSL